MDLENLLPLPPLCLEKLSLPREIDKEYFRFYNIDLESHYPDIAHHFGSLSLANFDIACHYYKQKNAKATLFVVHGYLDHVGLYKNIIEWGIKHNFSILAFDLPGHGLSSGESVSIQHFGQYRAVFDALLSCVQKHIVQPWHVVAQSTGAAIVMDYLLATRSERFRKVILLAPLVRPMHWWWLCTKLVVGKYLLDSVQRHFLVNSHNEKFLHFVASLDPLQSKRLSVGWILALQQWLKQFKAYDPVATVKPLIIQGTDDQTVDWRYNLSVVQKKFPALKLFKLDGARHHLVNESQYYMQQILQQMTEYVELKKP